MNGTSDRSGHPDPTDDPATDAADAAAAESARLAGYRLTGPPIRGGSGIVHPAIEAATGRAVALKALAPGHDLERLHREAEVLARIDHPNVAALRAFQTIDGAPTLVVDWVDGEPLHQVLHRDGPLGAGRSLAVLSGMAAALDAVHAAGVVHRDVSPANVMIGANGAVTVIDFGVSRSGEAATVTADGMLAGTPRYLAPEVIEGAEPTPRSDQYGAAIVLNELLVGSWPFPEANSMANALHHQLHTAPTPVDEVDPTLGPALTDAILRALDKDPARRFPSMAAFLDAASGVETAPATVMDSPTDAHVDTVTETGRRRRAGQPLAAGRRRGRLALAAVPVVAVVAAAALVLRAPGAGNGSGVVSTATPSATTSTATSLITQSTDAPATTTTGVPRLPADGGQPDAQGIIRTAVAPWDAGLAETLACNLLLESDFEGNTLPENFFQDGEDPGRPLVSVAPTGGVDDSGSLLIGSTGWGQWGEDVPVEPGRTYLFSANTTLTGDVSVSELSVVWLDADFDQLAETPALDVVASGGGQLTLGTGPAPAAARYAVPRLYKDASTGVLTADELVFAPGGSDCEDLLLG